MKGIVWNCLLLIGVLLEKTILSINIECHEHCLDSKCHGPYSTNCDVCVDGRKLVGNQCECERYSFDFNEDDCSLIRLYCKEIDVNGNCVKCDSQRYKLSNDGINCEKQSPSETNEWYMRPGDPLLDFSFFSSPEKQRHEDDFEAYIQNMCLELNSDGYCAQCIFGTYLDESTPSQPICKFCKKGCEACTSLNDCQTPQPGYFLEEQKKSNGDELSKCERPCKYCAQKDDARLCTSCFPGHYLRKTSFSKTGGLCLPCLKHCKSCIGPLAEQCTQFVKGKFLNSTGGTIEIKNCTEVLGVFCTDCLDENTCLECITHPLNTLTNQCETGENNTPNCEIGEITGGVKKCLKCMLSTFTFPGVAAISECFPTSSFGFQFFGCSLRSSENENIHTIICDPQSCLGSQKWTPGGCISPGYSTEEKTCGKGELNDKYIWKSKTEDYSFCLSCEEEEFLNSPNYYCQGGNVPGKEFECGQRVLIPPSTTYEIIKDTDHVSLSFFVNYIQNGVNESYKTGYCIKCPKNCLSCTISQTTYLFDCLSCGDDTDVDGDPIFRLTENPKFEGRRECARWKCPKRGVIKVEGLLENSNLQCEPNKGEWFDKQNCDEELCLLTDSNVECDEPDENGEKNCVWKVFQLVSIAPRKMELRINDEFRNFFQFELQSGLTVSNGENIICALILPELEELEAVCTNSTDNYSSIEINVSWKQIVLWSEKSLTNLIPKFFNVKSTGIMSSYNIAKEEIPYNITVSGEVDVEIKPEHIGVDFLIILPITWGIDEDLDISYNFPSQNFTSDTNYWSCSKVVDLNTGVEDTVMMNILDSILGSQSGMIKATIPFSDLMKDKRVTIQLEIQLNLEGEIIKTFQVSEEVDIIDKTKAIVLEDDPFVYFRLKNEVRIKFSHQLASFDPSLIKLLINSAEVESSYHIIRTGSDSIFFIEYTTPKDKDQYWLEVQYNGINTLQNWIKFKQYYPKFYVNLIHAKTISRDQKLKIMVTLPNNFQIKMICYHLTGLVNGGDDIQEVENKCGEVQNIDSDFETVFPFSDLGSFILSFAIENTTDGSEKYYISSKLEVVSSGYSQMRSIVPGITYRDGRYGEHGSNGGNLQNSLQDQEIFTYQSLLSSVISLHENLIYKDGGGYEESLDPSKATQIDSELQTSIRMLSTPPLISQKIKSTFSFEYNLSNGSLQSIYYYIHYYTPMDFSLTSSIHLEASPSKFTIEVEFENIENEYGHVDRLQVPLYLMLRVYDDQEKSISFKDAFLDEIQRFEVIIFEDLSISQVEEITYLVFSWDQQIIEKEGQFSKSKSLAGITPSEFSDKISLTVDGEVNLRTRLKHLNLFVWELNQLDAFCKKKQACLSNKDDFENIRKLLFNEKFKTIYEGIPNKHHWDNPFIYISRLSFFQGIIQNYAVFTDQEIDEIYKYQKDDIVWLKTNLEALWDSQENYSREDYGNISKMKEIHELTKLSLEYLISGVSKCLRYFIQEYTLEDEEQMIQKINDPFILLKNLEEMLLKRYNVIGKLSSTENEELVIGGVTFITPLEQRTIHMFSNQVGVELVNVEFDEKYKHVEMSVMMWKDILFDSLKERFEHTDKESSIEQGRTSVSFYNQFEKITPKQNPEKEINIYRKEDECRGEPCNKNKSIGEGENTLILCQCFKDEEGEIDTDTFADSFTSTLKKLTSNLFNSDLSKTYKEYFSSSAAVLLAIYTTIWTISIFKFKKSQKHSKKNTKSMKIKLMWNDMIGDIDAIVKEPILTVKKNQVAPDMQTNFTKNTNEGVAGSQSKEQLNLSFLKEGSSTTGDSEGSTSGLIRKDTEKKKKEFLREVSAYLKQNINDKEGAKLMSQIQIEKKKLKFWDLYKMTYICKHYLLSPYYITSTVYHNFTLVNLNFIRVFYHLGWSMFFALKLTGDKNSVSRRENFWLAYFFSPVLVQGFILMIKLMLKNEKKEGLLVFSRVSYCICCCFNLFRVDPNYTKKSNTKLDLNKSPFVHPNSKKNTIKKRIHQFGRKGKISKRNLKNGKRNFTSMNTKLMNSPVNTTGNMKRNFPKRDFEIKISKKTRFEFNLKQVEENYKPSKATRIKNYSAYFLMIFAVFFSWYLSYVSSINADQKETWPWGYWYIVLALYDNFIFPTFVTIPIHTLNLWLFLYYRKTRKNYGACGSMLHRYYSKRGLGIGSDVKSLTSLSDRLHYNKKNLKEFLQKGTRQDLEQNSLSKPKTKGRISREISV